MNKKIPILIITHNIPYPLDSGGNISQFALLVELQKYMDITLVLTIHKESESEIISKLKSNLSQVNIKVINLSKKNLQTKQHLICKRAKNLIKALIYSMILIKNDRNVQVVNRQTDEFDLPYRLQPIYLKNKTFIESLSNIIEDKIYKIIQIEFFEFLELINFIPLTSKTVFVHHEIRFERLLKSSKIDNANKSFNKYIVNTIKSVELNMLSKYNTIITFSEYDKNLLSSLLDRNIEAIPFPVLKEEFNFSIIDLKIDKLIFIGSDQHYPNKDGVDWFIRDVYDEIWKIYQLPFYIIGKWSVEMKAKYKHDKRIIFVGFVENLSPYYKNSISIVPVRIVSGIRAKILYAMANRSPVISSKNGVEGIELHEGVHFLQADSRNEFLAAIKKLFENCTLIKNITDNAFDYVLKNYHPDVIVKKRLELYAKLINN